MILDEPTSTLLDRPSTALGLGWDAPATAEVTVNADHPLAGLSPQRRTQDRIDAIASVLARLALRAGSKESEVTE